MGPTTREADVADRAVDASVSESTMTREELESQVRRFAQRFIAQMNQFAEDRRVQITDPESRNRAIIYQLETVMAGLEIAVGDNAVTNLLDIVVLVALTRRSAEDHWAPSMDDQEMAARLVREARQLEAEVWEIADSVLTASEQTSLRLLIDEWHEAHPNQVFVQRVRFGSFSGQRAAELAAVQQTGGLIGRVDRALDEVAETRRLAERSLFYVQWLPLILALQTQQVGYNFIAQEETRTLLDDFHRVSLALEQAASFADRGPDGEFLLADQILSGIGEERRKLLEDVSAEQASISQLLSDVRPIVASLALMSEHINEAAQALERTALATGYQSSSDPTDYDAMTSLAQSSAGAVIELRQLVETLETFVESQTIAQQAPTAFQALDAELDNLINRFFALAAALVLFYFGVLYVYRRLTRPVGRMRDQD